MQCYKKEDGKLVLVDCEQAEQAECMKFYDKFTVVDEQSNNADTEDARRVYGDGYCKRSKSYIVILDGGVAVGCVYGSFTFYLDGKRQFCGGSYNPYTGIGESREVRLCEE